MLIWITWISSHLRLAYHKSDCDESNCIPTRERESNPWRQEGKWELCTVPRLPSQGDSTAGWTKQRWCVDILLLAFKRFQRCFTGGFPTEGTFLCPCLFTFHRNYLIVMQTKHNKRGCDVQMPSPLPAPCPFQGQILQVKSQIVKSSMSLTESPANGQGGWSLIDLMNHTDKSPVFQYRAVWLLVWNSGLSHQQLLSYYY